MEWWSAHSGFVLDEKNTRFSIVAVQTNASLEILLKKVKKQAATF